MVNKKNKKMQPEKKFEADKILEELEKVDSTYNLINKCLDKVEETVKRIESTVEKITTRKTRIPAVKKIIN